LYAFIKIEITVIDARGKIAPRSHTFNGEEDQNGEIKLRHRKPHPLHRATPRKRNTTLSATPPILPRKEPVQDTQPSYQTLEG
jgi:hypothetical protein